MVFICVLYCAQAGQPELQAMATVGQVDIMVHQFEAPSYVVSGSATGKMIHVSYHDGQHYNSVHPTAAAAASLARPAARVAAVARRAQTISVATRRQRACTRAQCMRCS